MVRDWTGRALRRSSANGPPGAPGALLSCWAAGAPHPAGAEEAPPPSGPGGGGRPAPGPPSRPMSTPPQPGDRPGWPGASPHRLCRGPTGLGNPWVEKLRGLEGNCFLWRKLVLLQEDGWWEDLSPGEDCAHLPGV